MRVAAASRGMLASPMPAGHGLALLADNPDRQRRDGGPELVIRGKHPVVAMPVFSRWRDEIGEPVQKLKRRELDDAIGSRPRGLPPTTPPDPVGRLVPREHVADLGDAAGWAADHGQSLQCKGGPRTVPQQVFQALKGARHVAVDECDSDARVYGKPAVLPGEHVGGGRGVEQARKPEPADHAAPYPLGDRGQISLRDRSCGQEHGRSVGPLPKHPIGDARVAMHVLVERRAEAVDEGDGDEPLLPDSSLVS